MGRRRHLRPLERFRRHKAVYADCPIARHFAASRGAQNWRSPRNNRRRYNPRNSTLSTRRGRSRAQTRRPRPCATEPSDRPRRGVLPRAPPWAPWNGSGPHGPGRPLPTGPGHLPRASWTPRRLPGPQASERPALRTGEATRSARACAPSGPHGTPDTPGKRRSRTPKKRNPASKRRPGLMFVPGFLEVMTPTGFEPVLPE